jgi:hypothetical protein
MSGCNQSDASQGGVPLESALANDPQLLKALGAAFEQALRRPIETTAFTSHISL